MGKFVRQSLDMLGLQVRIVMNDIVVRRTDGALANRLWYEEEVVPTKSRDIHVNNIVILIDT